MRPLALALVLVTTGCSVLFPLDDYGGGTPDAGVDAAPGGDAATTSRYRDAVLADAPVLYLRLGEPFGAVANDATKQHDGTYGAKVTLGTKGALAGDPDTAVTFDGSLGSHLDLPAGLDFSGKAPFSVELWALQTARMGFGWVVDHQEYAVPRHGWGFLLGSQEISFQRWTDNVVAGPNVLTNTPLPLGGWHHLVGTFDGDRMVLYVDAVLAAQSTGARAIPATAGTWQIGHQNCPCSSDNFIGSLDEVAIYDKALDPKRVVAHFAAAR